MENAVLFQRFVDELDRGLALLGVLLLLGFNVGGHQGIEELLLLVDHLAAGGWSGAGRQPGDGLCL